jgi:hypothetical protein
MRFSISKTVHQPAFTFRLSSIPERMPPAAVEA